MPDLDQLDKDFNDHRVDDARFRAETAAYIKDAAQDIRDIKNEFVKTNDEQWEALKELNKGLFQETTERKLEDEKLRSNIRMAGYAKVVAILTSLTLITVGGYFAMFRGV
jgi:hypothetical protein